MICSYLPHFQLPHPAPELQNFLEQILTTFENTILLALSELFCMKNSFSEEMLIIFIILCVRNGNNDYDST